MTMNNTRKWVAVAASGIAIGAVAFLVGRAWAGGIPATAALTYSGRLEDSAGAPLSGDHPIQINLWNAATPGATPLCFTQSTPYTLTAGRFSVPLPDTCTDAIKNNTDVWVEVAVDGVSLGTTKLGAVPYAVEAGHTVASDAVGPLTTAAATTLTSGGNADALHTHAATPTPWVQCGTLAMVDTTTCEMPNFPSSAYEYGFKYNSRSIHPAICTDWDVGVKLYNAEPYMVNTDNPSTGMDWGGAMFYTGTNATDDDQPGSCPSGAWRHGYWRLNTTAPVVTIFGTNGCLGTALLIYCRLRT